MPRKLIADLTPEQAEATREYMREAKRKQRASKAPEQDKRGYRDRAEYMREYRKRNK